MITNAKAKLGDFVVSFGLATRREVEELNRSLRPGESIGQALTRAKPKTCDRCTIELVALVRRRYLNTVSKLAKPIHLNAKSFIGDILVALGFVSEQDKDAVVAWQAGERAANRDPGLLGQLLVARNLCYEPDVQLAMTVQRWLRGVK